MLSEDNTKATLSKYEKTPMSIYTIDRPASSPNPHVYCFDTLELLDAITEPVPINANSGEPFSDFSLKLINQRFRKEIAMYRRYKEIMKERGE